MNFILGNVEVTLTLEKLSRFHVRISVLFGLFRKTEMWKVHYIYCILFIFMIYERGYAEKDAHLDLKYLHCPNESTNCNFSRIKPCVIEDIPDDIDFRISSNTDLLSFGTLEVEFITHDKCTYDVTLLVNSTINSAEECAKYSFNEIPDTIHTPSLKDVYSIKKMELPNCNVQKTAQNRNETMSCQRNILEFTHVFTGCYTLKFRLDKNKSVLRGNKYLTTSYQRTDMTEPVFECSYDVAQLESSSDTKIMNLTSSVSLINDTENFVLKLSKTPERYQQTSCTKESYLIQQWTINLVNNTFDTLNCSTKLVKTNKIHEKHVICSFQMVVLDKQSYCMELSISEERCRKGTLWKVPPRFIPCMWIKRCRKIQGSTFPVGPDVQETKWISTNMYLLITSVIVLLIMTFGSISILHCLRSRKTDTVSWVNAHEDDSANAMFNKSDNARICETSDDEKGNVFNNTTNKEIVLLYIKTSTSFMELMTHLRKALVKFCHCTVHDWYESGDCTDVAKIGASAWFTKLLNDDCRIIWVDTPRVRELISIQSKNKDATCNNVQKVNIIDFRDMAFPHLLHLAKCSMKTPMLQYCKHFIVRLEGFETSNNTNDPFIDLSPYTRYFIPQHFSVLCSHLSLSRSRIFEEEIKVEENILQKLLTHTKLENTR